MKTPIPKGHSVRGHVIKLDPTVKQANALLRASGVNRSTYNWALGEWNRQHSLGEKPSAKKLKKQFNAIKGEQFPWVYESPRDANSQSFTDLNTAFQNFFKSCKGTRKGPKVGYPQFHCKGVRDSFYVSNDKFSLHRRGKRGVVRLPVIGDVRMRENLKFEGKILSGRVHREADQWYLSINIQADFRVPNHVHEHPIVGVDLGLKTAVIPSHGDPIDSPKPLKVNIQQLKRANCRLHRREKGSKNREKARALLARVHQRIANVRKDFWNKTTTKLCRENQTVVIEDLGMSFMLRNRKLSRAASDVGLGMFKPRMLYKAEAYGGEIVVADRLFPSTQRCSSCEHVKSGYQKILLGNSEYICDACGVVEDRDLNAARNLEQCPRLEGNWGFKTRTPMDDSASISLTQVGEASRVAEVGTKS